MSSLATRNKKYEMLKKNKSSFDNGTLTLKMFKSLPNEFKESYLLRALHKKYKSNSLTSVKCYHCAITALYEVNGYISDEEIDNFCKG